MKFVSVMILFCFQISISLSAKMDLQGLRSLPATKFELSSYSSFVDPKKQMSCKHMNLKKAEYFKSIDIQLQSILEQEINEKHNSEFFLARYLQDTHSFPLFKFMFEPVVAVENSGLQNRILEVKKSKDSMLLIYDGQDYYFRYNVKSEQEMTDNKIDPFLLSMNSLCKENKYFEIYFLDSCELVSNNLGFCKENPSQCEATQIYKIDTCKRAEAVHLDYTKLSNEFGYTRPGRIGRITK